LFSKAGGTYIFPIDVSAVQLPQHPPPRLVDHHLCDYFKTAQGDAIGHSRRRCDVGRGHVRMVRNRSYDGECWQGGIARVERSGGRRCSRDRHEGVRRGHRLLRRCLIRRSAMDLREGFGLRHRTLLHQAHICTLTSRCATIAERNTSSDTRFSDAVEHNGTSWDI